MSITVRNTCSILLDEDERKSIITFIENLNGDSSARDTNKCDIPEEVTALLTHIRDALAQGETISLSAMPTEVTTTAAASMLNVSRPTVMKLIRSGRLTARKVGSHHRLNTQEVCALREEMKQTEREAIFELINFEESLT
ncbi:helix-turn-helix domain-containing protein [Corynebacterium mustelae]|nr:helix-turn-helix domain-containing protein [Corynebacterium mustelae]